MRFSHYFFPLLHWYKSDNVSVLDQRTFCSSIQTCRKLGLQHHDSLSLPHFDSSTFLELVCVWCLLVYSRAVKRHGPWLDPACQAASSSPSGYWRVTRSWVRIWPGTAMPAVQFEAPGLFWSWTLVAGGQAKAVLTQPCHPVAVWPVASWSYHCHLSLLPLTLSTSPCYPGPPPTQTSTTIAWPCHWQTPSRPTAAAARPTTAAGHVVLAQGDPHGPDPAWGMGWIWYP